MRGTTRKAASAMLFAAMGSFLSAGCVAAALLPTVATAGAGLGVGGAVVRSDAKGRMPFKTAEAIGQNVQPGDIQISDAKVKAHEATWMADTPLGRYSCTADDAVQRAFCQAVSQAEVES